MGSTRSAARSAEPTTVVDIALPLNDVRLSSDSRVNSKSSMGMPWSASVSTPMTGRPWFVT